VPGRRNVIEDRDNQAYPFTTFELRDPIRVRRLRVENGELVLEDLAEITAVYPTSTSRAADEMLSLPHIHRAGLVVWPLISGLAH